MERFAFTRAYPTRIQAEAYVNALRDGGLARDVEIREAPDAFYKETPWKHAQPGPWPPPRVWFVVWCERVPS